ncbi:unnamed protein product [Ostreobium quekettii]|uniref:Uncharacterized protein n=1 Tax=Ostreobium quekettii TaxID=121088 RepID=A0A8S1JC17_9CHLO|nr:unnamed protein product [Ostreobium quekettii]
MAAVNQACPHRTHCASPHGSRRDDHPFKPRPTDRLVGWAPGATDVRVFRADRWTDWNADKARTMQEMSGSRDSGWCGHNWRDGNPGRPNGASFSGDIRIQVDGRNGFNGRAHGRCGVPGVGRIDACVEGGALARSGGTARRGMGGGDEAGGGLAREA